MFDERFHIRIEYIKPIGQCLVNHESFSATRGHVESFAYRLGPPKEHWILGWLQYPSTPMAKINQCMEPQQSANFVHNLCDILPCTISSHLYPGHISGKRYIKTTEQHVGHVGSIIMSCGGCWYLRGMHLGYQVTMMRDSWCKWYQQNHWPHWRRETLDASSICFQLVLFFFFKANIVISSIKLPIGSFGEAAIEFHQGHDAYW